MCTMLFFSFFKSSVVVLFIRFVQTNSRINSAPQAQYVPKLKAQMSLVLRDVYAHRAAMRREITRLCISVQPSEPGIQWYNIRLTVITCTYPKDIRQVCRVIERRVI
jgi:hypothetical protein